MLDLAEVLRDLTSRGESSAVAIVVAAAHGPVRVGTKVVYDGRGKRRAGDALLSDKLERELAERVAAAIEKGEPALVELADDTCGSGIKVYVEPQQRGGELLVLGHGPVADALKK